ncbi:low molecular weight protein-tyrosine-phosphatase [Palleronia sp. KMU-117]|uniref:low molecular weight protein-tyrosine-phosphatase n=1 Tax=Palleronia sp. KMU-117 TaxID=3434108 RepID=UPI003D764207
MVRRVLCVCLGNICRSPTAEAVLRAQAVARGLDLVVDSAGTGGWHVGKPPHPPAVAAAALRGYDLTPLRARRFSRADFDDFDLILAMDRANLDDIERLRPAGHPTPVRLFLDDADVPDPYITGEFDAVLDVVETGAGAILDQLRQ